jgi:hypothetical protein
MSVFRRRRRAAAGGAWSVVRDADGAVVGLWLESPADARDPARVETMLAWQDALHLLDRARTLQNNTADDRGGVFLLFGDPLGTAPASGEGISVDGRTYPVHEDFDAFAADATANTIALLKTRFDVPLRTHLERLMPLLTAAYGPDAPQTRASTEGGFHCRDCFADHSRAALLGGLLDGTDVAIMTSGSASELRKQLDAKSCPQCGSKDAVWIYDPSRRPR